MARLFDTTQFRMMEQGLIYTAENKKVISHNITNIDTPGYKSKYLTFSGVLKDKMQTNHKYKKELHLKHELHIDEITKGQPDGNNVDYEVQAAMLKSNALRQEAIINQIESEFRMMQSAMRKS
ncbi:MAG: flagellar basal body rod protein FlgB [Oscillospiraceae bacterium]|nr:flagellar basal body rod protein FlgB [Oscillospiraceae bacterium]